MCSMWGGTNLHSMVSLLQYCGRTGAYYQLRTIFRQNFPGSPIQTKRAFRHEIIRELVQPLFFLKASTQCPLALQSSKAGKGVKRLVGKHFAYRASGRKKCVVCSKVGSKKITKPVFCCPKGDVHLCVGKCYVSNVSYKIKVLNHDIYDNTNCLHHAVSIFVF